MIGSFINRLHTDSHNPFVQILDQAMDDILFDHPEIVNTTLIRREAERALMVFLAEGERDPIALASYVRAHARWSIRPNYTLREPINRPDVRPCSQIPDRSKLHRGEKQS